MSRDQISSGFKITTTALNRKRVPINVQENGPEKKLIIGVSDSKLLFAENDKEEGRKEMVIAKIENTFQIVSKKFKPTFVPPESDQIEAGGDRFEAAPEVKQQERVEYGLEKRLKPVEVNPEDERQRITPAQLEERELKHDLELLPDESKLEDYEAMPIEEFGRAMLRGMGWSEGCGVGKNRKVIDAIEYVRRPDRLGLGATPAAPMPGSKPRRPDLVLPPDENGRQRHVRKLDEKLVSRTEASGSTSLVGRTLRVFGGRHAGVTGRVLEVVKRDGHSDRARMQLISNEEIIEVRCSELEDTKKKSTTPEPTRDSDGFAKPSPPERYTHKDASRPHRKAESDDRTEDRRPNDDHERSTSGRGVDRGGSSQKSSSREHTREPDRDSSRGSGLSKEDSRQRPPERRQQEHGGSRETQRSKEGLRPDDGRGVQNGGTGAKYSDQYSRDGKDERWQKSNYRDVSPTPEPCWPIPMIKVRILDKCLRGGSFYLKKGTVVDVHPGGVCDVSVDDTTDIVQVKQSDLETVVPKAEGAPVMIVSGAYRGQKARLLESKIDKGVAAVQLMSDLSIQRLLLDDIAQYMGSMDEDDN